MSGGLYIGLMSGTSLDGVDAVLVRLAPAGTSQVCAERPGDGTNAVPGRAASPSPAVLAFTHLAFPPGLRAELLALNSAGANELHRAALAANGLAQVYAEAVGQTLAQAACAPGDITALGAHGQTVRHRPGEFDGCGYTTQLLNGALLAELTGIDVWCDFRSRDVAAGGQGAPLVPAFHAQVFARPGLDVAVLNLGGIANLSLLPGDIERPVSGFDCGPGNVLMDLWCQQWRGLPFDADGAWAASGQVIPTLLAAALADPYFQRPPPKSTGRDLFHAGWMADCLARCGHVAPAAADVQATWVELTAQAAVNGLAEHLPEARQLVVCGGGAHNIHLVQRLDELGRARLPGLHVQCSGALGVPADQVEALAFAWLALAAGDRQPGNLAAVTGAQGARVLGALYPA